MTIGAPPYDEVRTAAFGDPGVSAFNPPCTIIDGTLRAPSNYPAGSYVCVTGDVNNSDNWSYSDLTIVVYGNVLFEGNITLNDTDLLVMDDFWLKGNLDLNDSRLFADGNSSNGGDYSSIDGILNEGNIFSGGSSTLASGIDFDVTGNIEHTNPAGDIGLLMMSVGDFHVFGNLEKGNTGELLQAVVWAGGSATIEGNLGIQGGISAVGDLTIDGNVLVDGRGDFVNADSGTEGEGFGIISRR